MFDSQSHQSGELPVDDIGERAGTYANRSLAPDGLRSTLDFGSDPDVRLLPEAASPEVAAPSDDTSPGGGQAGMPARQLLPETWRRPLPARRSPRPCRRST